MCRPLYSIMLAVTVIGAASQFAFAQEAAKSPTTAAAPAARAVTGEAVVPPQPLFIVHLTTGPGWNREKPAHEQTGFKEHSQNLNRLRTDGMLVMGARYQDNVADKGMLILRAKSLDAVRAEFAADPMVKDKLFALDIAEFKPFYDGFIARPAVTVGAAGGAESALSALNWLAGCWFGRSGRNEFREHWMRPVGGMMMGMGRTTSGGKVVSYEAMRIELDAGGAPVFVAKPSGQLEASFKRMKSDDKSIEFENPTHDFPQRVKYQLNSEGGLDARIEGNLKGRDARIDFPMRRASCE